MAGNIDKQKTERILSEIKKRKEHADIADIEEQKVDVVIFTLNKDYYAFYGSDIKEILPYEEITYVPGCPDIIVGIINVRGDIESVINIHKLIGLDSTSATKISRIIIAEKSGIRSGILVDSVEDVISIPVSSIKRLISTLDKLVKEFAVGGETIYAGKYVTILDVGKLFEKIVI